MNSTIILNPNPPFSFEHTIYSHGWVGLLPNSWDKEKRIFRRVEQLGSGKVVCLEINGNGSVDSPQVVAQVNSADKLSDMETQEIAKTVARMLRIDEDLNAFYALCSKEGGRWLKALNGAGRLLRSPSLFEDIVKTMCTTNIQWGGTKRMVSELVSAFGAPFQPDPELKAFPTAAAITAAGFDEFSQKVRLGYRAAYVYECAQKVVNGDLDLKSLEQRNLDSGALKKELLAIKGIGNYAAATLLMLSGHYDELPVDSVFKEFVAGKYFKNKKYSEKKALAIYHRWGNWKHLAYWFDVWQGFDEVI